MESKFGENYRSPWGGMGQPGFSRETEKDTRKKGKKNIWLAAVISFLILVGVAGYFYFSPSAPSVGLEFSRPSGILVGEQFDLSVSATNASDAVLKNSYLSLFLPDGVFAVGLSQGQRVIEKAIGDLGPGSVYPETFKLIAAAPGSRVARARAVLRYYTGENPNAQFESSAESDVLIGESAVNLSLEVPQNVYSGQNFGFKVSFANKSNQEFKNVKLKIDYPPFFTFIRSTVRPEEQGNNSWDLGDLEPGSSGSIAITGNAVGPEKLSSNFSATLSSGFQGVNYNINSQSIGMTISSSPLAIDITVNGAKDYVAKAGEDLEYVLNYVNNSSVVMQNATIRAKFLGEMFDFATLQTYGIFDSLTNTISWLGANTPELLNLAPGQSGSVAFRIRTKNSFPIRLISDKNFSLKIQGEIASNTVPPGTTADKTVSLTNFETKVAGLLEIYAKALWRDADSGILNQGPYPPKANQSTQYTIHWIIKNYSTDATNVVVSAFLQSGARFTGQVKSSIDSAPIFNANSGLVTWNVGSVPATKGVVSSPIEAVFQVEVTPSSNQVGQILRILGETKIEGEDSFTGGVLANSAQYLDSDLIYDKTITVQDKRVQP